jgi:DNA-binding beta-propeller fold protein YncE
MRGKECLAGFALVACAIMMATSPRLLRRAAAAQGTNAGEVPAFEPDPAFPKLPNNWILGNVAGVAIDRHDNVWMIHRPRTVAADKTPAPPVLEFDASGKFLRAWGGDGAGYDWPDAEHNIFVDHNDNVWISGSSPGGQSKTTRSDDMLLKFTNTGKFLLEVGGRSISLGSKDLKSVNKPGDLFVSARTNEVYLADGYGNRRVVVFDAGTGAFLRMWGAFGNPPEDDPGSGGRGASGGPLGVPAGRGAGRGAAPVILDTEGPGPAKFGSPVHGIVVSNDNIVYVADRSNRRLQTFTPEGKYLGQMFVNRAGPSPDSVSGFALSPDKDQQFLYMADFGNSHIVVADRKKLAVLYQFGTRGAAPGDFQGLHHIAVDSKGNLYTAEVAPGARAQRFVFKGLSPALPPNALTPAQLPAKQ